MRLDTIACKKDVCVDKGGVINNNTNMETIIRRLAASHPEDPLAEMKIRYAWEIIRSEAVKCMIMLVIFVLLNKFWLYVVGLLFLLPLRAVSGGLHFRHELSCLIFSVISMVLGLVVFPEVIPHNQWNYLGIVAVALIIMVISPVASPNKPIISVNKWKRMKLLSVLITLIESMIVIVLISNGNEYEYGYPLMGIMAVQGLQLVPGAMMFGFGRKPVKERQ